MNYNQLGSYRLYKIDNIMTATNFDIDQFIFACQKSEFNDFETMKKYISNLEDGLRLKQGDFEKKRQLANDYNKSQVVYGIEHERRINQQSELKKEYEKLQKQISEYQISLRMEVHSITPELKSKSDELERLESIQQILENLNSLAAGDEGSEIFKFSDRQLPKSTSKILVIKSLLQQLDSQKYKAAANSINRKYTELREKVVSKFQASYIEHNLAQMKIVLPLCIKIGLMEEVSEYYIQKIFSEVNTLQSINLSKQSEVDSEIKLLYFSILRGFKQAFRETNEQNEPNPNHLFSLFGSYSESILTSFIHQAFENSLKSSMINVLKHSISSELYLNYLEMFYDQTTLLAKSIYSMSEEEQIYHLVQSYINALFDDYLEQYPYKEMGNLTNKYQIHSKEIIKKIQIKIEKPIEKKKFEWKKMFKDYKIDQTQKLTAQDMEHRLQNLNEIFMDPSLQSIFIVTTKALHRNKKIAKFNQKQKNQIAILSEFTKELGELILNLIKYTGSIIPNFNRKTTLSEYFFDVFPQLSVVVQRMEIIFETFSIQKSTLTEGIKLQEEKEELLNGCQQELQKLLGEALASVLTAENAILKDPKYIDYRVSKGNNEASQCCNLVIQHANKYLKKIKQNDYSNSQKKIIKMMGQQFVDLLIQHYHTITYTKQGLYQLLVDVGTYKKFVHGFDDEGIDKKYSNFKSLVDIYLIKYEDIKAEQFDLKIVKQDVLKRYKQNKLRNERT